VGVGLVAFVGFVGFVALRKEYSTNIFCIILSDLWIYSKTVTPETRKLLKVKSREIVSLDLQLC
jgi:hypothetical protein